LTRHVRVWKDEPFPLTDTGGVFGLLTVVVALLSAEGEAKTDETRAEAAMSAAEVFMMSKRWIAAWRRR
jgi:hypothetical protein